MLQYSKARRPILADQKAHGSAYRRVLDCQVTMRRAGAAVQAPCLFARLRAGSRRSRYRARGRGGPSSWTRASAADDVLGVVIVDHGSRRKASNDLLEEFVRMYKDQTGRPIVELAHMEIAEPDIEHAFGKCVEQGATTVAVSPFFLSPGRHWQEDIPTLAAEAAAKHPGIAHFVAAPIGLHPLMVDIVDSRLETCLNRLTDGGASQSRASRVSSPSPAASPRRTDRNLPSRSPPSGAACDVCDGTDFGCKMARGVAVDE